MIPTLTSSDRKGALLALGMPEWLADGLAAGRGWPDRSQHRAEHPLVFACVFTTRAGAEREQSRWIRPGRHGGLPFKTAIGRRNVAFGGVKIALWALTVRWRAGAPLAMWKAHEDKILYGWDCRSEDRRTCPKRFRLRGEGGAL